MSAIEQTARVPAPIVDGERSEQLLIVKDDRPGEIGQQEK
jgi:hypothetical protein